MTTLGIKISALKNQNSEDWEGYWCYTTNDDFVLNQTNIVRKSRFDAEKDAILNAKAYSMRNNLTFISEGYTI